jgi:5'-deoxynucleotidase YfbR-like HD superfamily hydrolase
MMTIIDFYKQKKIPSNLQRHMLRVAAVGKHIAENWNEEIDTNSIISALLLHDLGNLLKFDLSKGVSLFDNNEQNIDYWQQVKDELISTYGTKDEHRATIKMATEVTNNQRIMKLVEGIGSSNLKNTLRKNDWEQKIASYSDFRVTPSGYSTVTNRFEDIIERYKGHNHALSYEEKTREKMSTCLEIEKQLQQHSDINLQQLPSEKLETMVDKLKKWTI